MEESDIDIYLPAVMEAVLDVVHILNVLGIHWLRNTLLDKLDDVAVYRMIIIPYLEIYSIAEKLLHSKVHTKDQLNCYLNSALELGNETAVRFISRFCDACQECNMEVKGREREREKKQDHRLKKRFWVFKENQGRVCNAPPELHDTVEAICDILDEQSAYYEHLMAEERRLLIKNRLTELCRLEKWWIKEGYQTELLGGHLSYRTIRDRQHFDRTAVLQAFNELLHSRRYTLQTADTLGEGYNSYPMLIGILNGEKRIQLILVPGKRGRVLRTLLQFYASHVMFFMSGTIGAHLSYSSAKRGNSLLWDFTLDPRQGLTYKATKKYRKNDN